MSEISPSDLGSVVAARAENIALSPSAPDLPRKLVIIGTYDNAKTGIADNIPALILGAADAGATYGTGSPLHRLALKAELGHQRTVPTYIVPQPEAGGAVAALGELDFTVTGAIAGTIYLYIANDLVSFNIATGATKEEIADACVVAINADVNLPVTAVKVAVTFEVTITAKQLGTYGNDVSLDYNLGAGQVAPTGVALLVSTAMTGGTGIPDIQDALDGLGTFDNANMDGFTGFCHAYGKDTTTLDAIEVYGGTGQTNSGLYSPTVARPFRGLYGDVEPGSAGFTAIKAITDVRLLDRVQSPISNPGSPDHPAEIAAQAMGIMERVTKVSVAKGYIDEVLSGVRSGADADNWTKEYVNRNLATQSGISTTQLKNNSVVLMDMVTSYRPANVAPENNGYRAMVNIAKIQNMLNTKKLLFEQAKWKGFSIVADKKVVGAANAGVAKDIQDVKDDLLGLIDLWAEKAWIYDAEFAKASLSEASSVVIRAGGTGFDTTIKVQLSGVGGIINDLTLFDISLAVNV